MATKTLENLFLDTLKDLYYAEKKILRTLPRMAKAANAQELAAAFEKHRDETESLTQKFTIPFEALSRSAA
jgi:ferritin-like metal-binding protein YciE